MSKADEKKKQPESSEQKDESKASGTDTENASGTEESNSGGEKGQTTPQAKFSQEDVDRIVEDRLKRERDKSEKTAEKARREAEEQGLAKRQEFEELAKKQGERLTVLEPELEKTTADLEGANSRIQELESLIEADVKAEMNSLELVPSIAQLLEGLNIVERRKWLTEHRDELKKGTAKGVPPSPDEKSGNRPHKPSEDEQRARQRYYQRAF